ncbi:MAG: hypothetical protein CMB73_03665 [Euryarchaeota archaeon]|nr:hypothetical protein [Euryarchaeota archaeon]|tara:strand:- start:1324 stop:2157 length:834 start_codon:yes stop_codon:yes gene_type:complete
MLTEKNQIQIHGIDFLKIESGLTTVGTDKGGWVYASNRPKHEVSIPEYFITKSVLSAQQLSNLIPELNSLDEGLDFTGIDKDVREQIIGKFADIIEQGYEVRAPSIGEWKRAHDLGMISSSPNNVEVLADSAFSNFRGAHMDGSPRLEAMIGPLSSQKAGLQVHPRNQNEFATSAVPQDRRLRNTSLRLVISPKREVPTPKVPNNSDFAKNVRTELLCTLFIGIIPSFLIPVLRGFGSYATEGWANLLFGGIVAGFVTGAVWRPRRPTVKIEDAIKE